MSSASPTTTTVRVKPERLPVNPRRHKVPPEARKRVSKACNQCNLRRAKCSGGHPCERCQRSLRECHYPVAEETITITRKEYNELLQRCQGLDDQSQTAAHSHNSDSHNDSPSEHSPHEPSLSFPIDPAAPREGRILQDPDGTVRYLGESSGATFLNHLREYMATVFPLAFNATWPGPDGSSTGFISALGRYQTHDSRPLLTTTVDSLTLPTKDEALVMLSELRYWAQDGAATIESGGIYYWANIDGLISQYHGYLSAPVAEEGTSNLALINAAFALACQFNPSCAPNWDSTSGQTFFARARGLIGNPLDVSTIADAGVLSLLGFYLMNCNRRDAAYIYISVACHILLVHGVHRAWMIDEDGKRLFWTVYNLDRWLSCLMGRPVMIPDEAIKLDHPRETRGLPSARGLCAHIQLSRISHFIVSNIFDVSRQPVEPRGVLQCIQKALAQLSSWRESLPDVLQYAEESFSQDRAVYELQMAHNQLLILAVRPLLFEAVKSATASRCLHGRPQPVHISHHNEIEDSANAARPNIHLCRQVLRLRQPATLSILNIHYSFNAALSLELHSILTSEEALSDREQIAFTASLLGADQGSNCEFAKDCAKVLTDLVSIMDRLRNISTHGMSDLANGGTQMLTPAAAELRSPLVNSRSTHASAWSILPSDTSPTKETEHASASAIALTLLPQERESAHNELLAWLQNDTLQSTR